MNRIQLKIAAASLLPAVATMLFVQACGGGGDAVAQTAPDPMEGVWEAVVTQRDCATNAVIATFKGAQAMHRGGTLTMLIDFDGDRSVVETGNGRFRMTPVIGVVSVQ